MLLLVGKCIVDYQPAPFVEFYHPHLELTFYSSCFVIFISKISIILGFFLKEKNKIDDKEWKEVKEDLHKDKETVKEPVLEQNQDNEKNLSGKNT